jgi:hypothetical protein
MPKYATPTRPIRDELHATHRDRNLLQAIDDIPRRRPLPGISPTRIAAAMVADKIQREMDARLLALAATHEEGHA